MALSSGTKQLISDALFEGLEHQANKGAIRKEYTHWRVRLDITDPCYLIDVSIHIDYATNPTDDGWIPL